MWLQKFMHLIDRSLRCRTVEYDLTPRHCDDTIAGLKDVLHIMGYKYACQSLGLQSTDEAYDFVGFLDG